jgi:hypothetical protein
MRTCVAEINGEALIAFHAAGDNDLTTSSTKQTATCSLA